MIRLKNTSTILYLNIRFTILYMESIDLLARENEFKKLNKQLEKKTETLMKEIEQVMQKQDIFSEFSNRLVQTPNRHLRKHCDSPITPDKIPTKVQIKKKENSPKNNNTDYNTGTDNEIKKCISNVCEWCQMRNKENDHMEFLYAFVSVNVKENVLPQSFVKDRVTVENVCKFLSAKVKLMQEQIDKLQATIDKMAKQCEGHMGQLAGMESERLSLVSRANTLRSEVADVRAKYAAVNNKFNEKDRLYKEQRSVSDKLTVEMKSLRAKNANLEARGASQEEAIVSLKHQLETVKLSDKEFRDATRNLSASHQNAICQLEAKVKSLNSRIDKQAALIDNLKKQNALLATEGALKALEREYNEFLNSDLE
ncbi:testis-expressed protein 9 [Zerene cesonia]|uniref:testis-expressed protein 9 n=1 Tax=Zerene cesonia TaxID=33412 RepID=UPI0018E56CDB|nr:testis-expressed protein 9 [Zerene cesonia]